MSLAALKRQAEWDCWLSSFLVFLHFLLSILLAYHRFMKRSLWKSRTLVSGSVMIRDLERTTCTRNSVTLAVQMLLRACTRTWLPGTVLASVRSTYVFLHSMTTCLWPGFHRFFAWSRLRRRTMSDVLTSNSSLPLRLSSPSLIVLANSVRPLLPAARPRFKEAITFHSGAYACCLHVMR